MGKLMAILAFLLGFVATTSFYHLEISRADIDLNAVNQAQTFNDEGYGKDDTEYYNSQDDVTNDDEPITNQTADQINKE